MKIGTIIQMIAAGAVGALIATAAQGVQLNLKPVGMDYNDWAGILLAAASVVVTAVGVVVAIAAIWGFSAIKSGAEVAAVTHVTDQLSAGKLGQRLDKTFTAFLERRFSEGRFRDFLEVRVDEILYGGGTIRGGLDEDEEQDERFAEEAIVDDASDPDVEKP